MKNLAFDIGDKFLGTFGRGSSGNTFKSLTGIGNLTSLIIKGSLVLAGIIMLFYFIVGGIGIISSAGNDDPKQIQAAKQSLTTGLVGFIVVLMAYWIVKLLLQILGIQNIL